MEPELPCQRNCLAFYASNLWNVKTGQNNLWTGTKATFYPERKLFATIRRK